jgi:hypothetical protein
MRFPLLFLYLLVTMPAEAGQLCGDNDVLLVERNFSLDFSLGSREDIALPAEYGGVVYPAQAMLRLWSDGQPYLRGTYERPTSPGGVGIEYNLYRLEVIIGVPGDQQLISQDYTSGCSTLPAGLFPGAHFDLLPVFLTPHSDGSPRGLEPVRLRFWGR